MIRHPIVVGMFTYWTGNYEFGCQPAVLRDWLLSASIRLLSRQRAFGRPALVNHQGLGFFREDGSIDLHEALMSEGWCCKPLWKLRHFLDKDPRNLVLVGMMENVSAERAGALWEESAAWVGVKKSYARDQIVGQCFRRSLLGRALDRIPGVDIQVTIETDRVICSGGSTQLMGTHLGADWDFRGLGEHYSTITPEDSRLRFAVRRPGRVYSLREWPHIITENLKPEA